MPFPIFSAQIVVKFSVDKDGFPCSAIAVRDVIVGSAGLYKYFSMSVDRGSRFDDQVAGVVAEHSAWSSMPGRMRDSIYSLPPLDGIQIVQYGGSTKTPHGVEVFLAPHLARLHAPNAPQNTMRWARLQHWHEPKDKLQFHLWSHETNTNTSA